MDNKKHTPGPWTEPVNHGATRFEIQAHGKRIAVIDRIEDAHLIAAAPELLEALTMVRDADNDRRSDGLSTIPKIARMKIDAALAKAEGAK